MRLLTFLSQGFGVFDGNEPRLPFDVGHSRHIPWIVVLDACQGLQLLLERITLPLHLLQQHRPIMIWSACRQLNVAASHFSLVQMPPAIAGAIATAYSNASLHALGHHS